MSILRLRNLCRGLKFRVHGVKDRHTTICSIKVGDFGVKREEGWRVLYPYRMKKISPVLIYIIKVLIYTSNEVRLDGLGSVHPRKSKKSGGRDGRQNRERKGWTGSNWKKENRRVKTRVGNKEAQNGVVNRRGSKLENPRTDTEGM